MAICSTARMLPQVPGMTSSESMAAIRPFFTAATSGNFSRRNARVASS